MPVEIESTLLILADEPRAVIEEIASLNAIGAYSLTNRRTMLLHDTYYDTAERTLSGRGIALRTREHSGSVIVCLKQGEHTDAFGATRRDETELPWSHECREHLVHALKENAIPLQGIMPEESDLGEGLTCLGLFPIQDRETERIALDVSSTDKPEKGVLAEIALDTVRYLISGCRVMHHEIEVEASVHPGDAFIMDVTGLLKQAYGNRLRRWDNNKLITGLALEHLHAQGNLPARLGETIHLRRSSYDAINTFLKKGHSSLMSPFTVR